MAAIPIVNQMDKRYGIVAAVLLLTSTIVLLNVLYYQIPDPPPKDIPLHAEMPPLDEIQLENLIVDGGGGSGEPTDAPIDQPKPQTQQVLTNDRPDNTTTPTGQSNHTNANNNTHTASTPNQSSDPFNSGGMGGGNTGGSGTGFGQDTGTGTGPGNNSGGGARTRLNEVSVSGIQINVTATIHLKLTIDTKGNVVNVENIKSKTTTTDQILINRIINAVKEQVKYSKGNGFSTQYYTVKVRPN